MKTEIKTDLQIFVSQKKTNSQIKTYYLTYRIGGISYHKKYATLSDLLTELDGLNLIAGTWVIPIIGAPTLLTGETNIPDDEVIKTILSYKVIDAYLNNAGTFVVLCVMKGNGTGSENGDHFHALDVLATIKDFTAGIL